MSYGTSKYHNIDMADDMAREAIDLTTKDSNPDRLVAIAQVRALSAIAQNLGDLVDIEREKHFGR